jgi:hypothetical protein
MNPADAPSLYARLGSFDGITRIVHDMKDAHLTNPVVAPRFQAAKDLDHAGKMAVEFFCAGCGGPEAYTGRDLLVTHKRACIRSRARSSASEHARRHGTRFANPCPAQHSRSTAVFRLLALAGQVAAS